MLCEVVMTEYEAPTVTVSDPHFPGIVGEGTTEEEALHDLAEKQEAIISAVADALARLDEVHYE
jgi:predicted RNase H-like HicB family nuclease